MYVSVFACLHVYIFGECSALYISKTNGDKITKSYIEEQISIKIISPGFGENGKKKGNGVEQIGKETISEHLKNDYNDFRQNLYKTPLYMFFRMH